MTKVTQEIVAFQVFYLNVGLLFLLSITYVLLGDNYINTKFFDFIMFMFVLLNTTGIVKIISIYNNKK